MATFAPLPKSLADKVARYSPRQSDNHLYIEIAQVEHRLELINAWRIAPGSRILEIGCGQGTCTNVLAEAVGANGHIDAVDPGSPDYGAPFTLGQAQAHISETEIGDRITWHNAEPTEFLAKSANTTWDYAVLTHCIWYFDKRQVLADMLRALKGRVKTLLVAEYALKATEADARPHLLSALARASLEAHNKSSEANIRCLLSPIGIKETAGEAGWTVEQESNVIPEAGLLDGHWETGDVKGKHFLEEIEQYIQDERVKEVLRSSREAVLASVAALDGRKVRTMDAWAASFS
jgi:SAM-dependent methyltransferase